MTSRYPRSKRLIPYTFRLHRFAVLTLQATSATDDPRLVPDKPIDPVTLDEAALILGCTVSTVGRYKERGQQASSRRPTATGTTSSREARSRPWRGSCTAGQSTTMTSNRTGSPESGPPGCSA